MTRLSSALLFLGFFLAPLAFAEDGHWQSIVDSLLSTGISKVGTFDVAKFREDARQVHLGRISGAPPSVLSGSRESAYYRCGGNPSISDHLPSEAMASLDQLELHEILGSLCYDDRNYALSTALTTLAAMSPGIERQKLVAQFGRTVFASRLRLAGGTGVTGGGDLATLSVKNQVLKEIMGDSQNRLAATPGFLARFAEIDFEPLKSNRPRQVTVVYKYARGRESLAVYIPMERWAQGDRAALVHEAAEKIMGVFPAHGSQGVRTFRPRDCGANGPLISFPATNDPSIREIQDARGGLLLKCTKPLRNETYRSVAAPGVNVEEEPKSSGYYYFNCMFRYGAGQQINQLKSRAGMNFQLSASYGIENVDSLDGVLAVDAQGTILGATFFLMQGGRRQTPHWVKAQEPGRVTIQTTINGIATSLTCQKER